MNPDDISWLEYGFKTAVAGLFSIGGGLLLKLMASVTQNKDSLSEHKLHVSENYAKKTDLSPIYDTLKSIQMDIKLLLTRKNEEHHD